MNYAIIGVGVVAAAFVNNFVGFLWYGPFLFGNTYIRLSKVTPRPDALVKGIIGTLIASAVMAALMVCFMERMGIATYMGAFNFAWMSWLAFVAPVTLQSVLYANWPIELYLLNNGYNLLSMIAMSQVLMVAMSWA